MEDDSVNECPHLRQTYPGTALNRCLDCEEPLPPDRVWIQLASNGGTISYIHDPRETRDNGKPVYIYVRAEAYDALLKELETTKAIADKRKAVLMEIREAFVAAFLLAMRALHFLAPVQ